MGVTPLMLTRPPRGTIVPTALFVAMFALMISTLLLASVSFNSGLSLRALEVTEFRYLSLAASNELLSDLNAGLEQKTFGKTNPRRSHHGGWVTESWVERLEGETNNVFVSARTYRPGRPDLAESVQQLATYRDKTLTRVYTNVTDTNKDLPDPTYFNDLKDSEAWTTLPAPPRIRYRDDGTIESKPGEMAGTIPYVTGAPDGSLYALYAPTLDGWDDDPSPVYFFKVPITLPWGDFALNTIVAGGRQGMTVGELAPIPQVLVEGAPVVAISKGALFTKYSHDTNQWVPLPPAEEATMVNGEFQVKPGDYHLQGVAGAPVAYDGGMMAPLYRKGPDSIYRYTEKSEKWDVLTPPGQDVLLMGSDQSGNVYVQTGELKPVGPDYLLTILLKNLLNIYPNTPKTELHQYKNGAWSALPNPPSKFYDSNGNLVSEKYSSRGPSLSGIVGGKEGEVFVVNRPSDHSKLVDTIYKYSDGVWEVVPSPPNRFFDSSGAEKESSGYPSKLEICTGSDGLLIVRVPNNGKGLDAIFVQDEKDKTYNILKPIQSPDGSYEAFFSQMAGGRRQRDNGLGAYYVRATYF